MKAWFSAVLLAGAAAGAGLMVANTGCGIVGAPLLLPAAVAANADFQIRGKVIDDHGRPLDGVVATLRAEHWGWTPIEGGESTDNGLLRQVNKEFDFAAHGTSFKVSFARKGYYPAEYSMDTSQEKLLVMEQAGVRSVWANPNWPKAMDLPVVLLPHDPPDAALHHFNDSLRYDDYPRRMGIDLLRPGEIAVADAGAIREGTLYLTMVLSPPKPIDKKGTLVAADLNLPDEVTLHIAGKDGGFVRITPRLGYDPILTSDEAPAEGYTPEIRIGRERLREMRAAPRDHVREASEFFYFRTKNLYGKASFSWSDSGPRSDEMPRPLEFQYDVFISVKENDRNLVTHNPRTDRRWGTRRDQ